MYTKSRCANLKRFHLYECALQTIFMQTFSVWHQSVNLVSVNVSVSVSVKFFLASYFMHFRATNIHPVERGYYCRVSITEPLSMECCCMQSNDKINVKQRRRKKQLATRSHWHWFKRSAMNYNEWGYGKKVMSNVS